jgi:hypothetical protein
MGSMTAISAGALALALAAIPVAAPPALALAGRQGAAADCPSADGLISGVTSGLCNVLQTVTGTVTGTVDTLTGDTLKPVTKKVQDTTDDVVGTVGEAVPTATPTKSTPTPSRSALVPDTLREVCLPVLACRDQGVLTDLTDRKDSSVKPTPTGKPNKRERKDPTTTLPTDAPTPPQTETHQLDTTEQPVKDIQTADTDEPRIDLLWPNPFAEELTVPMRDQRVVRPSKPSSDVLGTSLTIALLTSAILATRIVQQRRQRAERPDSIPFEPARAGGSRHRLA